jgi:hypothetical protein
MQNEKDYSSIKSLHDHLFKWGRPVTGTRGGRRTVRRTWEVRHIVEEAEKGGMREEGKEKGHIYPHLICTGA